jgi:hypothetical protein
MLIFIFVSIFCNFKKESKVKKVWGGDKNKSDDTLRDDLVQSSDIVRRPQTFCPSYTYDLTLLSNVK